MGASTNAGMRVEGGRTLRDDVCDGGILRNVYFHRGMGPYIAYGGPVGDSIFGNPSKVILPILQAVPHSNYFHLHSHSALFISCLDDPRASHAEASELLTVLYDRGGFLTGANVDAIDRVRSYVERIDPSYTPELHPVAEHHYLDDSRTFGNDSDAE